MRITEAQSRVGSLVVYRAPHVSRDVAGERGVITSVNDHFVFVRYGTQQTSAATLPDDLELVAP